MKPYAATFDIVVQWRSGFYAAYAVLTAVFFSLVLLVPPSWREATFMTIILFDPTFMGFFFAGGLVLLEREQGVLVAALTTGFGFRSWWCAKVGSILLLAAAVVGSLTVAAGAAGFIHPSPAGVVRMALGIALTVPLFFSLGIVIAGWFPRILDYFLFASLLMLPAMVPLVELLGFPVGWVGAIAPIWGGMVLVSSLFTTGTGWLTPAIAIVSLVIWNVIAWLGARRAFSRLATGTAPTRAPRTKTRGLPAHGVRDDQRRGRLILPAEVKLMLRDPVHAAILFAPIAAALVLGRVLPWLFAPGGALNAPAATTASIQTAMSAVRSFTIILTVVMYGMLGGLLVLDEKDQNLMPVLRTMPGRRGWYLVRRGMTLAIACAVCLIAVVAAGGNPMPAGFHSTELFGSPGGGFGRAGVLALSLLVDLASLPIVFLSLSVIATNKVQGLAVAKVLNLISLPPLVMLALAPEARWFLGLFPTAWGSLIRLNSGGNPVLVAGAAFIGLGYAAAITALLWRRAVRSAG